MITEAERIMLASDFETLRTLWIYRARIKAGRITDERAWMEGNGFEVVDVPGSTFILDDGREILRTAGKAWVLRKEHHVDRLDNMIAHVKASLSQKVERVGVSVAGHKVQSEVCYALVDGQICGGVIVVLKVCPVSPLGKSGVSATATCDTCGHTVAIFTPSENVGGA